MPTAMHSSKRSLNSNSTLSKRDVPSSASTQKEGIAREFYRDGVTDGIEPTVVNDHDFPSASSGKVIPHGICDLARNEASLHLNSSRDTSELACESIELWWREQGPPCRRVAGSLRWWRQQQCVAILVQRGFAGTIEPAGTENSHLHTTCRTVRNTIRLNTAYFLTSHELAKASLWRPSRLQRTTSKKQKRQQA